MTDKKPSQQAMDKIMQGKIQRVPRWRFVLKNIALWFVGITCVFAGAVTVSLIIFNIVNSDVIFDYALRDKAVKHLFVIFPLLWILVTIIFIVLFDIFVRRTKRGYKYSLTVVMLVNIGLSVIIGALFYFMGVSYIIDDSLGRLRYYNSVEKRHSQMFNVPEEGMIVGRAVGCGDEHFTLITMEGQKWTVLNKNIPEFKKGKVVNGQMVMVVGKKLDDDIFVACDVRKRGMHGGNHGVQQRHISKINQMHNGNVQVCECDHLLDNLEDEIEGACETE